MSDSLIAWNPRIEEPSNPTPSVKISSSTSAMLLEVCCQVPRRSTKRKSTILTPASVAIFMTSDGEFAMCALSSNLWCHSAGRSRTGHEFPLGSHHDDAPSRLPTSCWARSEPGAGIASSSIPDRKRYVSCRLPVIVQHAGEDRAELCSTHMDLTGTAPCG